MLLVVCMAFRARGQFSAATVVGVVQDSSKAGITDAKLKLINTQTGTENDSATNQTGGFLFRPCVIPGAYTLQIERDGFATTQVNGIKLDAGDIRNLLIRMKVGAVTETVNVDASGITLNRTDASVSTLINRKLISTIPLERKNTSGPGPGNARYCHAKPPVGDRGRITNPGGVQRQRAANDIQFIFCRWGCCQHPITVFHGSFSSGDNRVDSRLDSSRHDPKLGSRGCPSRVSRVDINLLC